MKAFQSIMIMTVT